MSLTIENTQQISADVYAGTENERERTHLAVMTFSYRPGKRMGLSLEILDEAAASANAEDVTRQVKEFLDAAFERAAAAGLPVPTGEGAPESDGE